MLPVNVALLGAEEWIVILLIVVIFFGAAKIPQLARSLGRAKGEFERGAADVRREIEAEANAPKATPSEDERIRRAAAEMGIATEGRPLADIKADMKSKMA